MPQHESVSRHSGTPSHVRARPLTGYIGGKWFLRGTICPLIDRDNHTTYVEPFIGMGNVFLGRDRPRRIEVINDRSDQVVAVFRSLQRHADELARCVRFHLTSRTDYTRLFKVDPTTLTDIERAARFIVLRKLTFSSKDPYPSGFSTSASTAKVLDTGEIIRRIAALHERLDRVVIENLDFGELIRRYDTARTFFYLDPPYWNCTHLYREGGFKQADFARLAECLRRVKGRWLLSLNDHPEVRKLFRFGRIKVVSTRYNAAVGIGAQRAEELLIGKR